MQIIQIDNTQGHLVYQLFDQYRIFYRQPSDIETARSFIDARLRNHESIIFVALHDNRPVGFTQLYPKYSSMRASKNWILNDLFVAKEYRKQGIGYKLITTAINFAGGENASFVQLETAIDNYTAQSLYEKMGFKRESPGTDFMTYRISVNTGS